MPLTTDDVMDSVRRELFRPHAGDEQTVVVVLWAGRAVLQCGSVGPVTRVGLGHGDLYRLCGKNSWVPVTTSSADDLLSKLRALVAAETRARGPPTEMVVSRVPFPAKR